MDLPLSNTEHTTFSFAAFLLKLLLVGLQLIKMMHAIVAHTNTSDFAFLNSLDKCLPSSLSTFSASIRSMNEHEVQIFQAGCFQTRINRFLDAFVADATFVDLAGEENFFPRNARFADGFACWRFIAVHRGTIDLEIIG